MSIDCEDEPFWSATLQLCARAGVRVDGAGAGGPVRLARVEPGRRPPPCVVAGPFLLAVRRVEHTRAVDFAGPRDLNASAGCRISLFVWAEPKLAASTWSIQKLESLETDADQAFDPKHFWGGGGQVGSPNESTIHFHGDVNGTKIKRLGMACRFTLEGKTERFEVDNVLTTGRVERLVGGYRVALMEANKVADGRYAFTVEAGPGEHSVEDFDAFRSTLERHGPRLLDAQGRASSSAAVPARAAPGGTRARCR